MIISIILGMVLLGWQGFIFGYLQMRWLSYVYILFFVVVWVKNKVHILKRCRFSLSHLTRKDILLWSIIIFGVCIQVSSVWFNGVLYSDGLRFCCGNPSDNLWHIALTNQIIDQFPPQEPGMSGTLLQNYHYWANLVSGELIRIFHLPLIATQFQYMTIFISLFLGLSVVAFGQIVHVGRNFIRWLLVFLYFGGDLLYLLFFLLDKQFNFKMSSLEDGAKFLVNPPRAFAIVLFFTGLSMFVYWLRKKDFHSGILMAVLFGSLIGFKVYVGIFVLVGLGALGLWYIVKHQYQMLIPMVICLFLSIVIYLPVNSGAGGLYFTGLWIFENFIVQPDLHLERLELARRVYADHANWLRVASYEAWFIFLYIFAIFGTKLIGILQNKRSLSLLPKELHIFLFSGLGISAIAGFFFQQSAGGSNTFNFLVSVFLIGSIYTALACSYWFSILKNNRIRFFILLFILALTLPRVLYETYTNMAHIVTREGFLISNDELAAFSYLKDRQDVANVLVDHRSFVMDKDSPYIRFMTQKNMYLSGEGILRSHGIDIRSRETVVQAIFSTTDRKAITALLRANAINYIVMSSNNSFDKEVAKVLPVVFENSTIRIVRFSGVEEEMSY